MYNSHVRWTPSDFIFLLGWVQHLLGQIQELYLYGSERSAHLAVTSTPLAHMSFNIVCQVLLGCGKPICNYKEISGQESAVFLPKITYFMGEKHLWYIWGVCRLLEALHASIEISMQDLV